MPRSPLRPPPHFELKGIPNFRDGIEAWNAAWERDFPAYEAKGVTLELWLSMEAAAAAPPVADNVRLAETHERVRELCLLQEELRVLAHTSVLQPNFCWKKLTPTARKAHMHEGLLRSCLTEPVLMPMFRVMTSDITLASLENDNGEGFLTLLKRYLPSSEVVATKGVSILSYRHPSWTQDSIHRLRASGHGIQVQARMTYRDEFLTSFLYNTILSVFGTPRPLEISYKSGGTQYTTLDWGSVPKKLNSSKQAKGGSTSTPIYSLGHACESCHEWEREGNRFSVCKNCNEQPVCRKIYYCSRACQVSDWPKHKKICGKDVTTEVIQETTVIRTEASLANAVNLLQRMGPAIGEYKRSPSLIRQIEYLDVVPARDYVFFSSTGPRPFTLPCFVQRTVFRFVCQIAMSTGDPECIAAICEVLLPADTPEDEAFAEQLRAEYGTEIVSKAYARTKTQLYGRSPTIRQWINRFLGSSYGSSYRSLYVLDTPTPSFELTRKFIHDLREWWKHR
ncbi:hypothetical protein B0H16DRAFT_1763368 [Mycena metata]|uniref:MYND-type domain-containing protein n=1 Tax=Mycena metata TaxID=1033252 RepID=A0AAD7NT07_9AGAR|nr:hypothetical protein B0H16DRAFT_1763368 [Mycena metata]